MSVDVALVGGLYLPSLVAVTVHSSVVSLEQFFYLLEIESCSLGSTLKHGNVDELISRITGGPANVGYEADRALCGARLLGLQLQMMPVHLAVVGFHAEVLEALIKAGAELDAKYTTSADVLTKANTAVREALANAGLPCEQVTEDDLEYVGKDSYIQAVKAPAQALMTQLVKLLAAASETEMQKGLEAMEKKMVKHGNSLAKIVAAQEKLRPKDKDALEDALEERRVLFLHRKNTHRTIRSLRTMLLARGSGGE
eukprot:gene8497-10093_t